MKVDGVNNVIQINPVNNKVPVRKTELVEEHEENNFIDATNRNNATELIKQFNELNTVDKIKVVELLLRIINDFEGLLDESDKDVEDEIKQNLPVRDIISKIPLVVLFLRKIQKAIKAKEEQKKNNRDSLFDDIRKLLNKNVNENKTFEEWLEYFKEHPEELS